MAFYLYSTLKGKIAYNKKKLILLLFLVVLSLIAHYSCYSPGNFFGHYILLLIPANIFLTAYAVFAIYSEKNQAIKMLAILVSLYLMHYFYKLEFHGWKHDYCYSKSGIFIPQQKFSNELLKESKPGDRLMIWGWNNAYYVESELHPGSRYLYNYNCNTDLSNDHKDLLVNQYINDMLVMKPKFILELVGENQFYTNDTNKYALSKFFAIKNYVEGNYQLLGIKGEEKLYLRN
jgi:hypothetical protein